MTQGRQREVLAGRYELATVIGSGGAGVVWHAHDRVLERDVAVKLLHPDLASDELTAARFRAEASSAAKLTHPHAVTVYDIGHDGERDYIVMELVEGTTLAAVLEHGRLPAPVVALLGRSVAAALGAAHRLGMVHRDAKPANVLLTTEGAMKVADFGIARALGEAATRLTLPGTIMGTARYLAPEQFRDEPIDARADVYAVGLVLHEALTGLSPWGEGSQSEIASRRLSADMPPASLSGADVPPGLDAVVARATRLDPAQRYADGAALARALDPLVTATAMDELTRRVAHRVAGPAVPEPALAGPAVVGRPNGTRPHDSFTAPAETSTPPRLRLRGSRRLAIGLSAAAAISVLAGVLGVTDRWTPALPSSLGGIGATEPLTVARARDHDPLGDGREWPDRVADAIDDDPATTWPTETYQRADLLPPRKDGVGIWFDLGETRDIRRADLSFVNPGVAFEIWVGDTPPAGTDTPASWGRLAAAVSSSTETEDVRLTGDSTGRVVLVWFIRLPAVDGGHRADVAEARFHGR